MYVDVIMLTFDFELPVFTTQKFITRLLSPGNFMFPAGKKTEQKACYFNNLVSFFSAECTIGMVQGAAVR